MDYVEVDDYHEGKKCKFYTIEHCYISNIIRTNCVWEKHLHSIFEKYINNESIVIEGGCHIGTHTLKLSYLAKHVYAFEPLIDSNNVLNKNLQLNERNNVTLSSDGLSDKISKTFFQWTSSNNPGASGLANNPMGFPVNCRIITDEEPVNLTTIDSLNLEKLDFIKLDVEGYETLAIFGGMNTIVKCRPVITLESWSSHNGTVDIEYTKNNFKPLIDIGYKIMHISGPDFLFLP
uniref:Methyltransferase FkbM domain-containing protein n=1 Tax=viral metagenome TaxID=1070528 RepID=A0A6C0IMB0_9ZZZZ